MSKYGCRVTCLRQAHNISVDGECLLQWTLFENASVTTYVIGFTLTFEPTTSFHTTSSGVYSSSFVSPSQPPPPSLPLSSRTSELLSRETRQYCSVTPGLLRDSDLYNICLTARINHTTVRESTPVCSLVWIVEQTPPVDVTWTLLLIVTLGCSVGIPVAFLVVAVAVCHCRRRRSTAKTSSTPATSWSAATDAATIDRGDNAGNGNEFRRQSRDFDKPLVSQGSKRYVKSPRRREHPSTTSAFQTDSIDRRIESDVARWPVDGDCMVLSSEHHARILTMLVAATESRPGVYAEIADYAPPGDRVSYCNRRRSTGSPEANCSGRGNGPLDSGYSAPELHVYDEIADDTYDVIPIDNTKT